MEFTTYFTEKGIGLMAYTRVRNGKRLHAIAERVVAEGQTISDVVGELGTELHEQLVSKGIRKE